VSRRRIGLWLLPAVVAGTALRLYLLPGQVAGGDELHSVRAALRLPLGSILITYLPADHCLPLTAFYRLLLEAGVELHEMHLRSPVLASGIALLIAAPLAAARRAGTPAAAVFAWLVATSPVLVLYSRIIRSYMPLTLLSSAAAWFFYRFVESGRWRHGALYALCGAAAVYVHLLAVPFVLAPFAFLAGRRLLAARGGPLAARRAALYRWLFAVEPPAESGRDRWRGALLLGAIGAGLAAFLIPARASLAALIAAKAATATPSWATAAGVLKLHGGSAELLPVLIFWALALRGAVVLHRRDPQGVVYALTLIGGQIAGLLLLRPTGMADPVICSRYLIVILPPVLLAVACGLTAPWRRSTGGGRLAVARLAPLVVLPFLVWRGPLLGERFYSGSFMHRNDVFAFHRPIPAGGPMPPVYGMLLRHRPAPIIEYPWPTSWRYGRVFPHYQQGHGRAVIVSPLSHALASDRLAFRNMVAPQPAAMRRSRAAFVVVHTRLEEEEIALERSQGRVASRRDRRQRQRALASSSRTARDFARRLRRLWGPPDLADAQRGIYVWDLERLRRELPPLEAGAVDGPGRR